MENVGKNKKIDDKEYIRKFLNLLASKKDNGDNGDETKTSSSSGF